MRELSFHRFQPQVENDLRRSSAEMVIARFASHPVASSANSDPTSLPAYEAMARHLVAKR
jgi:hypothetical protein